MTRSDIDVLRNGETDVKHHFVEPNTLPVEGDTRFEPMLLTDTTMDDCYIQDLPTLVIDDGAWSNGNKSSESSDSVMVDDFAKLSVSDQFRKLDTSRVESGNEYSCTQKKMANDLILYLPDVDGDTSLHVNIMQEDDAKSIEIIKRAPDFTFLNVPNNLGQTPAHLAVLTNKYKILRKLVCSGAAVSSQDQRGYTPLHIACERGYLEIVKQLLRPVSYVETLENKYEVPFMAIPQNMNIKNFDGFTCLHLAVMKGDLDIVRLLLQAGADVNFPESKSGRTSLHLAAEQGLLDIVYLLLSCRRTQINYQNYAGYTPVQLAQSRGHTEITKFLFRRGASYGLVSDSSDDSDLDMTEDSML